MDIGYPLYDALFKRLFGLMVDEGGGEGASKGLREVFCCTTPLSRRGMDILCAMLCQLERYFFLSLGGRGCRLYDAFSRGG